MTGENKNKMLKILDPGQFPLDPNHDSAHSHVTGASQYVDDRLDQTLHCGLIYSRYARAKFKFSNLESILHAPNIRAIITASAVHHNLWGPIFQDQPLIADKEVSFVGEVIAVIVADTLEMVHWAQAHLKVDYQPLPAILTIDDAVKAQSFIGSARSIERGSPKEYLQKARHRLKGALRIKGADHFYLESNAALVIPQDRGFFEVHSSTQHPTETQHLVAEALGIPFSQVTCLVKRLGGGFGGKESQAAPIAAYAALAAHATKQSCRLILDKDTDMIITGKRNPFLIHYEVGFDDTGRIEALSTQMYSDGGAYADLSTAIMERAMLHIDNAYFIPHISVTGQVCKTNIHPHTAFRGFGGPKGVAAIETMMERIATHLNLDALDVRQKNVYRSPHLTTPYGQVVENNLLPDLFTTLTEKCSYRKRRSDIIAFNQKALRSDAEFVRGLSMTAVKFGISFTTRFLNQGNALVNIHRDGSIQISTGAVEMGQGVHQRICKIVADDFGLPLSQVHHMVTSTEKNANTSPTAASSGTDLNGMAAHRAAFRIKARLAAVAQHLSTVSPDQWPSKVAGLGTHPEFALNDPSGPIPKLDSVTFSDSIVIVKKNDGTTVSIPWQQLLNESYLSRISLCEYDHYKIDNLGFNKLTGQGQAFMYYTQGVAASEVEVSRYTGELKVLRTDILMDLGQPIAFGLDEGQIRGAFIQGQGWLTTENLVYNNQGLLLSQSPSTYKIPSAQDIPRIFNVHLVKNEGNQINVKGTKAVGEPPLLLGISVWTAIQDAILHCNGDGAECPIPLNHEEIALRFNP
jgi:xanthine dehydrogenase large subunit